MSEGKANLEDVVHGTEIEFYVDMHMYTSKDLERWPKHLVYTSLC